MKIRESINILSAVPELPVTVVPEVLPPAIDHVDELASLLDKIRMYSYSVDHRGSDFAEGVDYGASLVGDWVENLLNTITERTNGPKV